MRKKVARLIASIVDVFYPPFRTLMPRRMFRYAACGGGNLALSWTLYYIAHNFVVCKRFFDLGTVCSLRIVVSPHIATLVIVFPVTFLTGFWLQRNIAFVSSPLRRGVQLWRYLLSVCGSLLLTYLGMKLLVEALHIYPTPSFVIVSLVTIAYSYLMQHHFTFRGHSA
ncbi:MAG: GtrA family protein [Rikenellaceae bacterium]|jgi:putative flippase GtrA|nr:GtrA family protein [Rikenellaceae bacterium]